MYRVARAPNNSHFDNSHSVNAQTRTTPPSLIQQIRTAIPPKKRCAVLLIGQSGSGKSTMKQTLHTLCEWKCIDSDVLKRENPQEYEKNCLKIYQERQKTLPSNLATPKNLEKIEKEVKTQYQSEKILDLFTDTNKNWLFDTRGNKPKVVEVFLDHAKNVGLPVVIIHMQVTLKTALARTEARATQAPDGDPKKGKTMSDAEKDKFEKNCVRQQQLLLAIARKPQVNKILSIDNNGPKPFIKVEPFKYPIQDFFQN